MSESKGSDTPLSERINAGCECKNVGLCWYCRFAFEVRSLERDRDELLFALKKAREFVGGLPSGVLGTQEPAYQTLCVINRAIEFVEGDSDETSKWQAAQS